MTTYYLDTSALGKRYVQEIGTETTVSTLLLPPKDSPWTTPTVVDAGAASRASNVTCPIGSATMLTLQLTLAARYLWGHKLRTFLTTLAIVFGAWVIFSVIAALIPARQAAGMEIVRALQYE
jgi:hypothetical protein